MEEIVVAKDVVTDVVSKSELQASYTVLIQKKSQELQSTKSQIAQLRKAEDQLSQKALELVGAINQLQELLQSK
jgi:hypothetical protein